MVMPFRNILRLSVGDGLAKGLAFLAMVYLARTLGVESYGVRIALGKGGVRVRAQ